MGILFVIVILGVVTAIALACVGRLGELPEPSLDTGDPADADARDQVVAFDVVARGYRMAEVDAVVSALQRQVAQLQARQPADRGLAEQHPGSPA